MANKKAQMPEEDDSSRPSKRTPKPYRVSRRRQDSTRPTGLNRVLDLIEIEEAVEGFLIIGDWLQSSGAPESVVLTVGCVLAVVVLAWAISRCRARR